jgi:hypothetical protein
MTHLYHLLANALINPTDIGYNNGVKDSSAALAEILNLIYTWAGIVAVLVIIIAGYLFMTARGDPAQVKRGKDAIRGAVFGLVFVILAFIITQFVLGRF